MPSPGTDALLLRGCSSPASVAAMPTLRRPTSRLSAVVTQVTGLQAARDRFLSPLSTTDSGSVEDDDDNDDLRPLDRAMSSASSNPDTAVPTELEAEFAAALLFVDSYQGPHRILTQENSTVKRDFYAYAQQATVGPCSSLPPPVGLSKFESAKWEKWRSLGQMTRQEAMKRYTTALDNLVDDWKRSTTVRNSNILAHSSSASEAPASSPTRVLAKTSSMFERLPQIYDEVGELQERFDEETRKRDEMEAHLLNYSRENRSILTRELNQVDEMRNNLTALAKSLEDDVVHHYNELQRVAIRQQELNQVVENSIVLSAEVRMREVYGIVQGWIRHTTFRRMLFALMLFRLWNFARNRQIPQVLAKYLIRGIAMLSSLDAGDSSRPRPLLHA